MPQRPEDEIAVVDRAFLQMVRASLTAGYLCSSCKSTVRAADVVALLVAAERWVERDEIIRTAVGAFADALHDAVRPEEAV